MEVELGALAWVCWELRVLEIGLDEVAVLCEIAALLVEDILDSAVPELVVSFVEVLDMPDVRSVIGVADVEIDNTVVRDVLGRLFSEDESVVENAVVREVTDNVLVGDDHVVAGVVIVAL